MILVKLKNQEREYMTESGPDQSKPKNIKIHGHAYGRGLWVLLGASAVVLFLLFTIESSRAISAGFGMKKRVEVERIPADEARSLGISPRNR